MCLLQFHRCEVPGFPRQTTWGKCGESDNIELTTREIISRLPPPRSRSWDHAGLARRQVGVSKKRRKRRSYASMDAQLQHGAAFCQVRFPLVQLKMICRGLKRGRNAPMPSFREPKGLSLKRVYMSWPDDNKGGILADARHPFLAQTNSPSATSSSPAPALPQLPFPTPPFLGPTFRPPLVLPYPALRSLLVSAALVIALLLPAGGQSSKVQFGSQVR